MKALLSILFLSTTAISIAQTYPPDAGQPGSTAVLPTDPSIVAWATGATVERGYINISNPSLMASGSNFASYGVTENAIGPADGSLVSLGDHGSAVLTFAVPITNGPGFDFAVFENGGPFFLELAFVEASSDGVNFFRFPAHSLTQTATQMGGFGTPQAVNLNNLAGKYGGNGTPFDLSDIPTNPLLNKENITHIKIIDVVGNIDPQYATYDSFGNIVNESWPTPFNSCGFDLDAVGVINQSILGVSDFEKSNVFLYPNPASEKIFIRSKATADVVIYDLSGRLVASQKNSGANGMDISNLTNGIYVAQITSEEKTTSLRLVIK